MRAVEPTLTPAHVHPRSVRDAMLDGPPTELTVVREDDDVAIQSSPPSGTVTFLFTDVEDSTRLWEDDTALMEAALERHDDILRSAIVARGGYVFSTAGDAFSAAFDRVSDAVDAAVEAQRALAEEPWVDPVVIRVRMGLHSGEAQERDGDYFGPVLNRTARIMSVGHGGQVLVSAATAELLADGPVELLPAGELSLRGLGRPEVVGQVVADGMAETFPPLRTVPDTPSGPNNLPLSLDEFVGRNGDVIDVEAALSGSRLVTLTGAGGIGKTRLAVEAAHGLLSEFVDGVWLVELAPVSEAAAVPFVVGTAVGVVPQPGKSMLESLVASLAKRNLLLILDNCEHLIDEVADLVSVVESRCSGVTVLATSREGLGLRGERLLEVRSLPMAEAARLFVARAGAAGTDVAVTDGNALGIVERLDGMPLAIELAAARTRGLSVRDIEQRLAEMFRLLRGSGRGRVERHQTLWNTVAWSHQLLEPVERSVFDRLSVFAGGFTLQAARRVCAGQGVDEFGVEDAVLGLVDRSMVAVDTRGDGTRYRLLETLRQFGEAQLLNAGQTEMLRGRHARWYAEFARQAGVGSKGRDGVVWSRRFRAELDNFRAVVYGGDVPSARRILASLEAWPLFWETFEYIDWAVAVIDPAKPDDPDWIGTALWAAYGVDFAGRRGDIDTLLAEVEPDLIPPGMLSYMWSFQRLVDAFMRGEDIIPLLRPHLDLAATPDNDYDRLWATSYVSWQAVVLAGWVDLATEIWSTLADDPARNTVPTVEPMFLSYLGFHLASIRDPSAFDCLEASRQASIDCCNTIFEHAAVCYQIPLHIERGDLATAWQRITTIISRQIRTGSQLMLWMALPGLVRLLDETGQRDEALEIWAEVGHRPVPMVPAHRADIETRLGRPSQPRLDNDELVTRTAEILGQRERATATLRRGC